MPKTVFFLFCCLFSFQLLAQQTPQITQKNNSRIETYFYHQTNYDSFRLHIKGKNDTFLQENFYRNGRLQEQVFRKDSSLNFNHLGMIISKTFGEKDSLYLFDEHGHITEKKFFRTEDYVWDSTVTYFGRFVSIEGIYYEDSYKQQGQDTIHTVRYTIGQYGSYGYSQKVGAKFKLSAFYADTTFDNGEPIVEKIDTVFQENGYPLYITIENGDEKTVLTYDELGRLQDNSQELIPFKDNILCAYGFLNGLGDTIVTARYDKVEKFYSTTEYTVFIGDKCFLLKYPNIVLKTPEANEIREVEYLGAKSWGAYIYRIDSLYGLIDKNGKVLIAPQRYMLRGCGIIENGDTICKCFKKGYETLYLNAQLRPIFPPAYECILHGNYFQYYINGTTGLTTSKGIIILPNKFDHFDFINDSTILTTLVGYNNMRNKTGVFNMNTRQWILDTNYLLYYEFGMIPTLPIVFKHRQTLKYGLVNRQWQVIVPPQYDTLSYANKDLFIAKKDGKVFFINFKEGNSLPPTYFYEDLVFAHSNVLDTINNELTTIYYAKKGGKWGIVNERNQVLYPFSANYVGENLLVHDKRIFYYDETSFPRDAGAPLFEGVKVWKPIQLYHSQEKELTMFIDRGGNMVVPPIYYIVKSDDDSIGYLGYDLEAYNNKVNFYLLENQAKARKIVLIKSGIFADYPFDYYPKHTVANSKLIIVADTASKNKQQNIGVVNIEGRLLTPCRNFAATIGDPLRNIYFVRPDTPLLLGLYYQLDTNWIMYNYDGKQLGTFRTPFTFYHGLGIGQQGDLYGIFDTLGRAIVPPQYPYIYREPNKQFMYLFENQGLSTTVTLKDADGKTLIAAGKYDGISNFYGKYALVSAGEKVGLIDTFGREIIAPLDLKATNYVHFIDSLDIVNQSFWKEVEELRPYFHTLSDRSQGRRLESLQKLYVQTPVAKDWQSYLDKEKLLQDTVGLDRKTQNQLWNLMLEVVKDDNIIHINDQEPKYYDIQHSIITNFEWVTNYPLPIPLYEPKYILECVSATSKTIAFSLADNKQRFFNFILQNGVWKQVTLQDILDITMYKHDAINALLIQKIKALKDVDLDCTEESDFVKQVLDKFLITKNGIDFYFPQKNTHIMDILFQNIRYDTPVTCTWDELRPFLKMRF